MADKTTRPISLEDLPSILQTDLTATLRSGILSPAQPGGCVLGLLLGGQRRILTFGQGVADGLYEIGSVTKTFTGLLLGQMVEEHMLRLETPIRDLLPPGLIETPSSNLEITLLDLSTHRSGLPRLPRNLRLTNPQNPYAGYDTDRLYTAIRKHGVARAASPPFLYSNFGVGLLGQLLADASGKSYNQLLLEKIFSPLHMNETFVVLPHSLQRRFVPGFDAKFRPAQLWDMAALTGAGGIRSTVSDMLVYLEAQLRPNQIASTAGEANPQRILASGIITSQVLYREAMSGTHIALNWLHVDENGSYWHNGGTGGFSSYACFNRMSDFGLVVLCNVAASPFTDALARHVARRMTGRTTTWVDPLQN